MLESTIRDEIHRKLTAARKSGLRIWWLKVHGHQMQRTGVPDFIVCYGGRFFAPELKVPGEDPTLAQKVEIRDVIVSGGAAGIVHSWVEFCEFLSLPDWVKEIKVKS